VYHPRQKQLLVWSLSFPFPAGSLFERRKQILRLDALSFLFAELRLCVVQRCGQETELPQFVPVGLQAPYRES
jgi:hypothetical protein